MNHFGEIRRLTEISQPTVGVLLNIYPAHTEGVGSVEGVARAKGEIVQALPRDAMLVHNADDPRVARLAAGFAGRRLGFGFGSGAHVQGLNRYSRGLDGQVMEVAWQGAKWPVSLGVPGVHQALNALAAVAVSLALGLPPEASGALAGFTAIHGRSQVQDLPSGVHLLNDCYNANPGSMATALATLAELKGTGRAAAALADMLELGTDAPAAHRELGRQAAAAGLDFLVIYGQYRDEVAAGAVEAGLSSSGVFPVATREEGAALLKNYLRQGDWLLVKGPRSTHMENIIDLLRTERKHRT